MVACIPWSGRPVSSGAAVRLVTIGAIMVLRWISRGRRRAVSDSHTGPGVEREDFPSLPTRRGDGDELASVASASPPYFPGGIRRDSVDKRGSRPARGGSSARQARPGFSSYPGDYATLTAAVSPARRCSIVVYYKSGPSRAQGLYSKTPSAGRVSWTWKVGTNTTPGRWAITVSCGSAGTLRTSFLVR
jgi:hypothetical protein